MGRVAGSPRYRFGRGAGRGLLRRPGAAPHRIPEPARRLRGCGGQQPFAGSDWRHLAVALWSSVDCGPALADPDRPGGDIGVLSERVDGHVVHPHGLATVNGPVTFAATLSPRSSAACSLPSAPTATFYTSGGGQISLALEPGGPQSSPVTLASSTGPATVILYLAGDRSALGFTVFLIMLAMVSEPRCRLSSCQRLGFNGAPSKPLHSVTITGSELEHFCVAG